MQLNNKYKIYLKYINTSVNTCVNTFFFICFIFVYAT